MVKSRLITHYQNLFSRLLPIICAIFLAITLYFLVSYSYQRLTIVSQVGTQLQSTVVERQKAILAFLENQKKQSARLTINPSVVASFIELNKTFDSKKRLHPNEQSDEYKKEEAKLDLYFDQYRSTYGFRDIFFIQPTGFLFYTNKIDVDETNLFGHALAEEMISKSFDRIRMTFTTDISEFGISSLVKEPALYVLQPVFADNKFVGALAVWIDEAVLYKIVQNYSDLGRSGDILLAKNIGDRVLFVAPSRLYQNIAFKKLSQPDKSAKTPSQKASLGNEGYGAVTDSFGIAAIASWIFVPQVNLGLTVEVQRAEIWHPLLVTLFWLKFFLVTLLIFLLIWLFQARNSARVRTIFSALFSKKNLRIFFLLSFIIGLLISAYFTWNHYYTYRKVFENTKELAESKIRAEATIINQYVVEIEKIAQMIAKDLQTNSLKKEDIALRIGRDLKELPDIISITVAFAPFAFDPKERLYGFQAQRVNSSVETKKYDVDYMIPGNEAEPTSGWFDKAIKHGAFWSDTFYDPATKKQHVLYATPFYDSDSKEPIGVIAIVYNLDKIITEVRSIEVGKTGYAVILSSKIQFLHHPLSQYVKEKVSILDITREQNNVELKDLAEQMKKGGSGFGSYYDHFSKLRYWIAFEPIPSTHWTIASSFSNESLDLPTNQLHKQRIWILVSLVIALLFLVMFISHVEQFTLAHLRNFAVLTTILFASALVIFWITTRKAAYQPRSDITVVRDQINTDKFLEFLQLESAQRNEQKPIAVPTGIIIHTLVFQDANKISITGYVWQKIKKGSKITPGVRFPDALDASLNEVLRKQTGDEELIGWNVKASFLQKTRFSWFPFDRVHVDIQIASADFVNNVLIIPDFGSYQSLDLDPLPGVINALNVPGFDLERSFFSFSRIPQYAEVGIETLRGVTETVEMHYNLVLQRKLTNPFIIYFLPLLIILFSIYAVFLVTFIGRFKFDVFKSLSAYTALFFSLIILHQTLRNQYQAGELLYVEYFFFFTYITLLFLILHSLMLQVGHFVKFINKNVSPYLRVLFWPIQFILWFIVTMITFYAVR